MKTITSLLTLVILALVITIPSAAQARRPIWERDMKRFDAQDAQTSPPKNGILFVGSSSILRWDLDKYFPDLPVLNRGFGGSQTFDVIDYFDRVVVPYEPSTVVFYSGDNDISNGKSPDEVITDVIKLVSMVHEKFPEARFIILPPKPSVLRWKHYPKMKRVGELQKQLADENDKVIYVDIATPALGPDGQPLEKYLSKDKLHLSPEGYEMWTELLRPHLEDADTTAAAIATSGTQN